MNVQCVFLSKSLSHDIFLLIDELKKSFIGDDNNLNAFPTYVLFVWPPPFPQNITKHMLDKLFLIPTINMFFINTFFMQWFNHKKNVYSFVIFGTQSLSLIFFVGIDSSFL
jgi:hypothetical protein